MNKLTNEWDIILSFLDKNVMIQLSMVNRKFLGIVNKYIIQLLRKVSRICHQNTTDILKSLFHNTSHPLHEIREIYSIQSYKPHSYSSGFLSLFLPRRYILYGKCANDYFYLSGTGRYLEFNIDKLIFSSNLILLPFHIYSNGNNITDWLDK